MYPSPSRYAQQDDQLNLYEFLGRIIGKGLYTGVLLDASFAKFFLSKWLGNRSFFNDLMDLDPTLFKGLMFLKNYNGNFEDLGLNMTVVNDGFGENETINLIPNGSEVSIDYGNRIKYIFLVANYKLNVQIEKQCNSFFKGLADLIQPKWLKMFNETELQTLICGEPVPINVANLRQNTVYGGVYDAQHPTIEHFWDVVSEFNPEQLASLCKFVTSCTRPPLLGFGSLEPKFCIRFAGQEQDRLPTASTCVNLLKLPAYTDKDTLRM
jgi:ubiquitin-protein ligase E3 C